MVGGFIPETATIFPHDDYLGPKSAAHLIPRAQKAKSERGMLRNFESTCEAKSVTGYPDAPSNSILEFTLKIALKIEARVVHLHFKMIEIEKRLFQKLISNFTEIQSI